MTDQRPLDQTNTAHGDSIDNRPHISPDITILLSQNHLLLQRYTASREQMETVQQQMHQQMYEQQKFSNDLLEKTLSHLSNTNKNLMDEMMDIKEENKCLKEEIKCLKEECNLLKENILSKGEK